MFSGLVTKAPVRMRAMADAPPWMTPLDYAGALQPGRDCEDYSREKTVKCYARKAKTRILAGSRQERPSTCGRDG